jgi:hypothetical protein
MEETQVIIKVMFEIKVEQLEKCCYDAEIIIARGSNKK